MSKTQEYEKNAVLSGYWKLYRYNPNGEPKLTIDPPFVSKDYSEFTLGQARYFNLSKKDPEKAEKLITSAKTYNEKTLEKLKNK